MLPQNAQLNRQRPPGSYQPIKFKSDGCVVNLRSIGLPVAWAAFS